MGCDMYAGHVIVGGGGVWGGFECRYPIDRHLFGRINDFMLVVGLG